MLRLRWTFRRAPLPESEHDSQIQIASAACCEIVFLSRQLRRANQIQGKCCKLAAPSSPPCRNTSDPGSEDGARATSWPTARHDLPAHAAFMSRRRKNELRENPGLTGSRPRIIGACALPGLACLTTVADRHRDVGIRRGSKEAGSRRRLRLRTASPGKARLALPLRRGPTRTA